MAQSNGRGAPIPDVRGSRPKCRLTKPDLREGKQNAGAGVFDKCPSSGSLRQRLSGRGDDVFQRLAADKAVDVSGNIARATLNGPIGPWRAVRRHDYVRQFMERVAGGARRRIVSAWIAPPGVERRSADDPIAQGAVQRLLLDDRAARQIDQEGAGLHRGKPAAVNQPHRLGG